MHHRQSRTYPLLGILLANLLTNAVIGKLAPYSSPWLPYNRPSSYAGYNLPHYPSSHYQPPYQSEYEPHHPPAYESHHPPPYESHYPPQYDPRYPPQYDPQYPLQYEPQYNPEYQQSTNTYWSPIYQPHAYGPPPLLTTVSITTPQPETIISQETVVSAKQIQSTNHQSLHDDFQNFAIERKSSASTIHEKIVRTNQSVSNGDLEAVASNTKAVEEHKSIKTHSKRATYTPERSHKRGAPKRVTTRDNKYRNSQKKRKYTTTLSYYYDSYEEDEDEVERTTTRYKLNRKNTPSYSRRTTTVSDEYDESYEITTRPYRRRRPTAPKNIRRPVYTDDYNYDNHNNNNYYSDNLRESFTDSGNLRPRQQTTTEDATDTTIVQSTTTPTTDSTTATMNVTTTVTPTHSTTNLTHPYEGTSNDNVSITFTPPGSDYLYPTFTGYGPSNGNENISITYGPPVRANYFAPYVNWYTQQSRINDIEGKVHDIIDFDTDGFARRIR